MKSILDTRPIFHKLDETIRGHVFCSFLALVIRKELDRRLGKAGHCFEWVEDEQRRGIMGTYVMLNGLGVLAC